MAVHTRSADEEDLYDSNGFAAALNQAIVTQGPLVPALLQDERGVRMDFEFRDGGERVDPRDRSSLGPAEEATSTATGSDNPLAVLVTGQLDVLVEETASLRAIGLRGSSAGALAEAVIGLAAQPGSARLP